jgi:hypothetical protein
VPLDPWRLRFGYLLLAILLFGPLLLWVATLFGRAQYCAEYWTPERKIEQLWIAYLDHDAADSRRANTSPEPVISQADINEMFVTMRRCASQTSGAYDACVGKRAAGSAHRPTPQMTTTSGMVFSWTEDVRHDFAEHIRIDVVTASGVKRTRSFYPPGCFFDSRPWRMPK